MTGVIAYCRAWEGIDWAQNATSLNKIRSTRPLTLLLVKCWQLEVLV